MNSFLLFSREDLKLIKWQIIFAIISLILSSGIYLGTRVFEEKATIGLSNASAEYERARSSVALIEQEEATIIEYIDRFQELASDGVVEEEDRLYFYETIAGIRAENNLFPVDIDYRKQSSLRLQYDPSVREPGEPINLNSSSIELSLSLLHEEDLSRLLTSLLNSPGLYQIRDCDVVLLNENSTNFYILSQHLTARCEIFWYTFDLDPPISTAGFGL